MPAPCAPSTLSCHLPALLNETEYTNHRRELPRDMADTENYEDFKDPDLFRSRPTRLALARKIRTLEKKLELMVKKYTKAGERHKLAREAEMEAVESEMEELRENCSFCYSCELDGRHYSEAALRSSPPSHPT